MPLHYVVLPSVGMVANCEWPNSLRCRGMKEMLFFLHPLPVRRGALFSLGPAATG